MLALTKVIRKRVLLCLQGSLLGNLGCMNLHFSLESGGKKRKGRLYIVWSWDAHRHSEKPQWFAVTRLGTFRETSSWTGRERCVSKYSGKCTEFERGLRGHLGGTQMVLEVTPRTKDWTPFLSRQHLPLTCT